MNKRLMAGLIGFSLMGGSPALYSADGSYGGNKKAASQAKAPAAESGSTVLDGFERADWGNAHHDATTISVASAPGMEGNAIKINYDLKDSKQWVVVYKTFNLPTIQGKSISFLVKGKGPNNALEVKMTDDDGSNFGVKKMGLTNSPDWQLVVLNDYDFTYWWGGDNQLQKVKDISFAISAGDGGAGEVYLDQLGIGPSKVVSKPKDGMLDNGESIQDWIGAQADGASVKILSGQGQVGKGVEVDYSFPQNQWVALQKKINVPLDPNDTLAFSIKGEGDANNFEFKIKDKDGSVFGKTFPGMAASPTWQEVRVPVSELQYLWGGDNQLNADGSFFLDLAISGQGGKGKVMLDNIKIVQ